MDLHNPKKEGGRTTEHMLDMRKLQGPTFAFRLHNFDKLHTEKQPTKEVTSLGLPKPNFAYLKMLKYPSIPFNPASSHQPS